jgi:translation initiation factor IF-2
MIQMKANSGGVEVAEIEVGTISEYFAKPMVAGIELESGLKIGDTIRVKGHTTDIIMTIDSIQVDNKNVAAAQAGDAVGIKLPDRARKGDTVFIITA